MKISSETLCLYISTLIFECLTYLIDMLKKINMREDADKQPTTFVLAKMESILQSKINVLGI